MAKAHSDTFTPPFWLRPAMVQTIIASQKFRRSGVHAMEACAREVILDCGADESTQDCSGEAVRLMGSYSEAPNSKGLLILLHGWEGSQDSTYVMSSGRQAFDNGYSVFRLNFRDHGPTHHLNKALFHSALFNEVYAGVSGAAALANDKPVFVAGFSLGGNFALRVAREQAARPIKNLAHIFAISPVTNPLSAAPDADKNPLVKRYFLKKWTTSLAKKQAAFPDIYDFGDLSRFKSVMELSDIFVVPFTGFASEADYFNSYRIHDDDLLECPVPLSLIMGADDPVMPGADILALNLNDKARLFYHDYGGHNGFFQSLRGPTWYDGHMQKIMAKISG